MKAVRKNEAHILCPVHFLAYFPYFEKNKAGL
jgi:hypothetical protein